MLSIKQKYENDITFKFLVDTIENLIHNASLTPSEVRMAATLACIHYEIGLVNRLKPPDKINEALMEIEKYINKDEFIDG